MGLIRISLAFSFTLAATLTGSAPADPAHATSIAAARPHDPQLGCEAILHLIGNLNSGRVKAEDELVAPHFYTDALGKVESGEETDFLHAMRNNEGRADGGPIRLFRAYLIHRDRVAPTYLVVLERQVWRETRLEDDDMLQVVEIHDPRHYHDNSYWLASFRSNSIRDFREAGELYRMMDDSIELAGCSSR